MKNIASDLGLVGYFQRAPKGATEVADSLYTSWRKSGLHSSYFSPLF